MSWAQERMQGLLRDFIEQFAAEHAEWVESVSLAEQIGEWPKVVVSCVRASDGAQFSATLPFPAGNEHPSDDVERLLRSVRAQLVQQELRAR